jgi:hypothetical protein
MVLEHGGDHDRLLRQDHRPGEQVDRLGGVLGEHHDIALGVGADKLPDDLPRLLERRSAGAGFVPRPPMHAGGERQEPLHGADHGPEWRRGRCVVQVGVPHQLPVEQRHELVHPHDLVTHHDITVHDVRYRSVTRPGGA